MIDTFFRVIDYVLAEVLAASNQLVVADLLLYVAYQAVFAEEMLATYRVAILNAFG